MNRIYLVRHGENLANLTKEFSYRRVDYPLTEKGILQARQTALYFKDKAIDAIYASPLKRGAETAAIIAAELGLPFTVMENFREVNVGELEGAPVTPEVWRINEETFSDWLEGKPETRFPGGENYYEVWDRLRSGLFAITDGKDGCNLIVVGHGGMFYVCFHDLCAGVTVDDLERQPIENCSISEVQLGWQDGTPQGKLLRLSDVSHLSGGAADLVPGSPDPADWD